MKGIPPFTLFLLLLPIKKMNHLQINSISQGKCKALKKSFFKAVAAPHW
jgi:hypothetical protein